MKTAQVFFAIAAGLLIRYLLPDEIVARLNMLGFTMAWMAGAALVGLGVYGVLNMVYSDIKGWREYFKDKKAAKASKLPVWRV